MSRYFSFYNTSNLSLIISISGILFGYDAGIISGAMLFIKKTFEISSTQVGEIVSAVPLGALIAAIFTGYISDLLGRKKLLLITAILFLIGSLGCALANDPFLLIISRLLLGFAIGMGSSLSPMYISEMAEKNRRGKLVTLYLISVNFGIFISYLISLLLSHLELWRLMLGLGVIPASVLLIFSSFLPESARWLIANGKTEEGIEVLKKIHGNDGSKLEYEEIKKTLPLEKITLKSAFQFKFFKVIFLGALIGIFTQAVGINAIIYYAHTLFQKTGFNKTVITMLATLGIGFVVTLSAIFASIFIDQFGRRKLLLSGLCGIILSLLVIIFSFTYVHDQKILGWLALISFMFFVACQGISVGPACFLMPSEIFPAKIRGFGMGVSITFNWLTNFLVALLFPIALDAYGVAFVFKIFLALSVAGFSIFYFFIPETRNVSLENIELNILANKKLRLLGQ